MSEPRMASKTTRIPANQGSTLPVRSSGRRPGKDQAGLTSEAIAADLAAFRMAGGTIEVLGTTRTLQRIGDAAMPAASVPPAPPKRRR
jgi:hypothetical protein